MTTADIVKQVRFCIDEGYDSNNSDYSDDGMNAIIQAKIAQAFRWCLMNADASILMTGESTDVVVEEKKAVAHSVVSLDKNDIRVLRVKGDGWRRAVLSPLPEDGEGVLMAQDRTAGATCNHPVVALQVGSPSKLLVYPESTCEVTVTTVRLPDNLDSDIPVPVMAEAGFVYYIAFLLLTAYGDDRAERMLGIAKMELGIT